jgi:tetrapyrrole methylase family protein/MazG family protein
MKFNETRPLYLLEEIAAILRAENGCAWDREQTSKSLKPYLIEEAYEVCDAIENENQENLKEELGDLLYQVYAHAQIAREEGLFTIDDVASGIVEKLIRRHPHVFGEDTAASADEVLVKWEKIKQQEKSSRESVLDGVPKSLPALLKAFRVQQKASRIGFDWEEVGSVVGKLDEEVAEFKEAIASGDRLKIEEETGDILFTLVNLSRFIKVNPEEALQRTVDKFMSRFKYVEQAAAKAGRRLEEMSLDEMDVLWNEAKKQE